MRRIVQDVLTSPVLGEEVRCEHLLQILRQKQDKRLVVLQAGPGTGKNWLAVNYYHEVEHKVWLSIPEEGFGFHDFLNHLTYALHGELDSPGSQQLLVESETMEPEELVSQLINLLTGRAPEKLFIFIADMQNLQFLPGEQVHLLEVFFSFLPVWVQVILTCNRSLTFPLLRLGLAGEIFLLEESQLSFIPEKMLPVAGKSEGVVNNSYPEESLGNIEFARLPESPVGTLADFGTKGGGSRSQFLTGSSPGIVRFQLFGAFTIRTGKRLITQEDWVNKKACNLLKYLLLNRSRLIVQDRILELFWPDLEMTKARQNMYVAINVIRKMLEPDLVNPKESHYITSQHGYCKFNTQYPYWLDLEDFENDYAEGIECYQSKRYRKAAEYFERARNLYKLGFLRDTQVVEWCVEDQVKYRGLYLEMTRLLSDRYMQNEPERAAQYARELQEVE